MAQVEDKTGTTQTLSDERLHELFREMLLIRRFEEKVEERFRAGAPIRPGHGHVQRRLTPVFGEARPDRTPLVRHSHAASA